MTYEQVKEIVKQRAGTKYRGTALQLVQKLANGLYQRDPDVNVEKIEVTKKVSTICGWVGVEERQLRRLLEDIEEVTIVEWADRKITYRMCFDAMRKVETLAEHTKRQKRQKNAARAQAATEARREIKLADKAHALYLDGLRIIDSATIPLHEHFERMLLAGCIPSVDQMTDEQKQAYAAWQDAQNEARRARWLAGEYDRIVLEKGRDAAEQFVKGWIEENPTCLTAQRIKAGVEKYSG